MNNNDPIVLGKIKKGSTGKPIAFLIIFLFLGAVILFAPNIINYFGDYNVIDLIANGQIIDFIKNHDNYMKETNDSKKEEVIKETNNLIVNTKTVLSLDEITLNNFKLTNREINFEIKYNNLKELDNSNYYLVLTKDNKELFIIKLTSNKNIIFKFNKELNDLTNIKGTIKEIKDYPKIQLITDESGIGSIECSKDDRKIDYLFEKDKLIKISDKITVNNNTDTLESYNNLKVELEKYGALVYLEDMDEQIYFESSIDLYNYENKLVQNDYYLLNTTSSKIKFEMNAKGYDCK